MRKREPLNRGRKIFKRTAIKTNKMNLTRLTRGGIRL